MLWHSLSRNNLASRVLAALKYHSLPASTNRETEAFLIKILWMTSERLYYVRHYHRAYLGAPCCKERYKAAARKVSK